MKKTIAIVMLGLLVAMLATSKDSSAGESNEISVEIEKAMQEVSVELEAAMQELEMELGPDSDINIMLGLRSKDSRTPKLGVYLSDMTFKQA